MSVEDRTPQVMAIIRRRAIAGMKVAERTFVSTARELAPVQHGDLRKGIHGEEIIDAGGELRCRVVDSVEYAIHQELGPLPGTKHKWKFTPHMRPATDHMQRVFKDIIEKAVFWK